MKIDDCKTIEEFEAALAEYAESIKNEACDDNEALDDAPKFYIKKDIKNDETYCFFEFAGHHYPKSEYFQYLEAKGPLRRSIKENAEYEALKLHFLA